MDDRELYQHIIEIKEQIKEIKELLLEEIEEEPPKENQKGRPQYEWKQRNNIMAYNRYNTTMPTNNNNNIRKIPRNVHRHTRTMLGQNSPKNHNKRYRILHTTSKPNKRTMGGHKWLHNSTSGN